MSLPYASDCYFWKTSKSGSDKWIERAKKLISDIAGDYVIESYGSDSRTGCAVFMIAFQINDDKFKLVWPVLPVQNPKDEGAAKRQAATMLYHDVKNKCMKASVFGARTAFFEYLMIPDGRSLSEVSNNELMDNIPDNLLSYKPD